jgi:hypothetical protein
VNDTGVVLQQAKLGRPIKKHGEKVRYRLYDNRTMPTFVYEWVATRCGWVVAAAFSRSPECCFGLGSVRTSGEASSPPPTTTTR